MCVCVCVRARARVCACVQVSPEGRVVEERNCGGETETEEGGKQGRDKEKGRDRERQTDTERQEEWQTVVPPAVEGDAGSVWRWKQQWYLLIRVHRIRLMVCW